MLIAADIVHKYSRPFHSKLRYKCHSLLHVLQADNIADRKEGKKEQQPTWLLNAKHARVTRPIPAVIVDLLSAAAAAAAAVLTMRG